jgi:hypothetical protein
MTYVDEWGRSPEVRRMRMIFQRMESGHNRLTHEIGIPEFDTRLPRWRDAARSLFDQLWSKAAATGPMDEIQAGHFYVHCLARVMTDDGIAVPDGVLPGDGWIEALLEENLS